MTKIKICGITRVEDALASVAFGADFIGLVFVPSSPRLVGATRAREIVAAIREREREIAVVGVFRDSEARSVGALAHDVGLDYVQLHGDESDADAVAIGAPVIKTFRVGGSLPDTSGHDHAAWHLFDTRDDVRGGGTGRAFDWSLLAGHQRRRPVLLAGGLHAGNVSDAIRAVQPDAVDVSSGVESSPGIKDHEKLRAFIERVRTS
jgi:phosphoribosylanthranilate isomerase